MSKKDEGFTIKVVISEYQIVCLLISAWESASGYWARSLGRPYKEVRRQGKKLLTLSLPVKVCDINELDEEVNPEDIGDNDYSLTLDKAAILRGLELLPKYPRHLLSILTENADGETGDVFLQLCLFGEIKYS